MSPDTAPVRTANESVWAAVAVVCALSFAVRAGAARAGESAPVSRGDNPGPVLMLSRELGSAATDPPRVPPHDSDVGVSLTPSLTLGAGTGAQSPAQLPAADQLLIAEISLNGVSKGEFTVMALAGGDFLVGESDLKAMGVQPPYGVPIALEGEAHYSLRALKASELRFDEAKLALFVTLPPERLPKIALDLQSGRPPRVVEPRDNSGFFNYRFLYSGDDAGGTKSLALATEVGVRVGDSLLRSESAHVRGGAGPGQDIRYGTSLTHDDRSSMNRWIFGDFSTASGDLGNVLNLGGISFSKTYQIDPYFIRQPMAGFTGNITSVAQAEIYLDGTRIGTQTLQPGQFELRNLNYFGGQRQVEVVIRDAFGREQRLVNPFYFTDANLREGLHEYSYNVGFQRQNLGVASNDYGKAALSAFHRYGVSDSLTLGGRGEAEPGRFNLGPTAALRSDRWGVLSGSVAVGRSPSGSGSAEVVQYAYQARQFNSRIELRHYSAQYETVGQAIFTDRPKTELSVSASYGFVSIGSLSADWHQLRQYQGDDRRSVSLGYSRNLFGTLSLLASISRVASTSSLPSSTNLFFGLTYSPKKDFTANFFHNSSAGNSSEVLQFGNNTPVGEGFGYRVVSERTDAGLGSTYSLAPSFQFNGQHGEYTAALNSTRSSGGGSQETYQLGIGGGIAYVGGALAFSRPITDSFGIVKVGDLEGVRVYQSAQEIGRTNAAGTLFLPNLGSYVANHVAIDDRDIPIDYVIADKAQDISPPLRSGSLIRFDVTRIQAIIGRLSVRDAGVIKPVEYIDLLVTAGGKEMHFPTGRAGEFYIENLKPGRYSARFVFGQRQCAFELTVPESQQMLVDLGELNVCQF